MRREVEKDPWEPRLKCIKKDNATKGGLPPWVVRGHNLNSDAIDPKTGKQSLNYGTVVVKSLWWPGAYTFYNNGRTQHIYCGDGQKNEPYNCKYYPVAPPKMLDDREERKCFVE